MLNYQKIRNLLPPSLQSESELVSYLALAGSVSLVLVSIAASQALLAVSIIGFLWVLKRNKHAVPPGIQALVPLIVFMIWSLITIFASNNITLGLQGTKKFFLFLLLPIVPLLVRGRGRIHWIYKTIFFVAVVSSLKGLAQFAANPDRDLLHRITGFMSQWMTYSGLLMLVLVLLIAYAFCNGVRGQLWVFPVGALIVLALVLSLTRNSWMGAIAGIVVLVLLRRPRAVIFLLAAILILYAMSPIQVKQRIQSIVDTSDPRTHVYLTALHMIQENPWLGVGPKNVNVEALKYRDEQHFPEWMKRVINLISTPAIYQEEEKEYPGWLYQHMHNNLLQIAAETGIPGLMIWLWFMCKLAWDAWGCYRFAKSVQFPGDETLRREALTASTAALAAWAALLVAGMFEYNFGDSEVLTLFLFIMSTPYAFAVSEAELQVTAPNGNGPTGTAVS